MLGNMSSSGDLHFFMKKRSGGRGPFATSVGLLTALMEPASTQLHVAKPVRRSARSMTLAVLTTERCCSVCTCNTPYCMMTTSSPFCVDDYSLLFCKLCDRSMDDIYMYMSMGFCTEECRDEYFLEYRYRLAMAMEADSKRIRIRSEAREAPVAEGEAAIGYRRIFFICADVESFP